MPRWLDVLQGLLREVGFPAYLGRFAPFTFGPVRAMIITVRKQPRTNHACICRYQ